MKKAPLIFLIVSGVLLLMCIVAVILILLSPSYSQTSPDEMVVALIPGCGCCGLSLFLVIGAIVWLVIARKQ